MISANKAMVKSQISDKQYKVNMLAKTCECPDFVFRGVQCKHLRAVALLNTQEKIFKDFCENNLARNDLLLEWN